MATKPDDANAGGVARTIVVVDTPFDERPFPVHYGPAQDGVNVTFAVMDRVKAECPIASACPICCLSLQS